MENTTAKPPSSSPKRFFDIVPANKTVPDTSSRPILVTNKPLQTDTMVNPPEPRTPAESPPTSPSTDLTSEPEMPSLSTEAETSSPAFETPAKGEGADSKPVQVTESAVSPQVNQPLPELPPETASDDIVVVHHGYSTSTLRTSITIMLILLMLVVIADLLLDLNFVKLTLPHTHFFTGK